MRAIVIGARLNFAKDISRIIGTSFSKIIVSHVRKSAKGLETKGKLKNWCKSLTGHYHALVGPLWEICKFITQCYQTGSFYLVCVGNEIVYWENAIRYFPE